VNQELCRKQWLEATEQCAELTNRCGEVQHDNEALQTKLKHARLVHWLSPLVTLSSDFKLIYKLKLFSVVIFCALLFLLCHVMYRSQIEYELNKRQRIEQERDAYVSCVHSVSMHQMSVNCCCSLAVGCKHGFDLKIMACMYSH